MYVLYCVLILTWDFGDKWKRKEYGLIVISLWIELTRGQLIFFVVVHSDQVWVVWEEKMSPRLTYRQVCCDILFYLLFLLSYIFSRHGDIILDRWFIWAPPPPIMIGMFPKWAIVTRGYKMKSVLLSLSCLWSLFCGSNRNLTRAPSKLWTEKYFYYLILMGGLFLSFKHFQPSVGQPYALASDPL